MVKTMGMDGYCVTFEKIVVVSESMRFETTEVKVKANQEVLITPKKCLNKSINLA